MYKSPTGQKDRGFFYLGLMEVSHSMFLVGCVRCRKFVSENSTKRNTQCHSVSEGWRKPYRMECSEESSEMLRSALLHMAIACVKTQDFRAIVRSDALSRRDTA
jgi:hypothetical protein